MKKFAVKYWAKDEKGQKVLKEVPLTVEAYKHAAEKGMTLRQYVKHIAHDADYSMGDPLDQMYAQSGLFDSQKFNMPSMTLKELQALAKTRGITGAGTMKKGPVIEPLKTSDKIQNRLPEASDAGLGIASGSFLDTSAAFPSSESS